MSDGAARRPPQRRHLAIVHPEEAAVGLVAEGAGWALPAFDAPWAWASEVPVAAGAWGSEHALLACLAEADEPGDPPALRHRLLLAEPLPGVALPTRWWRRGDEPPAGLPAPLLPALRDAVVRLEGGSPAGAWAPFAQRGATDALDAALAAHPTARAGAALRPGHPRALRQRRAWPLSSVWWNDEVVLKVVPPRWAAEGPLTSWLADVAPDRVPRVVAHGRAEAPGGPLAWSLQARVASGAFDGDAAPRCAAAMGDLVARIGADLGTGTSLGLADRRPGVVAAALDAVWASPELGALTAAQRAALPELDRRWRRRLEALDAAGLPPVLVHGDLHPGNVLPGVAGPAGDTVIDWTDAAVGWPGVDLLTLLGFDAVLDDPAAERAIAAYADAAGPALGPLGAAGVRLGLAAAPAFHAVAYAGIEADTPLGQRWMLEGEVRALVRRMLGDEGLG
jgi:hypothetical protein